MSDISGDHSGSWTHTGSVTVLQQLAAGAALREDPEVLIRRLFTAVAGPMGLDFFIHFRYAGDGHALDLVATQGLDAEALPALHGVVLGQAVCGVVAQTRTPMAYADLDRSQDEQLTLLIDWGARAYVSYPLLDGTQLLGTLSFGSRTRPSLTDGELEVLRLATDLLSAALATTATTGPSTRPARRSPAPASVRSSWPPR